MFEWLSQVLQIYCFFVSTKIKINHQKKQNQNQTVLSTEEGSQSGPESDVENTNECDLNENETDPGHVEWDKHFQNDISIYLRNRTKNKAVCVCQ